MKACHQESAHPTTGDGKPGAETPQCVRSTSMIEQISLQDYRPPGTRSLTSPDHPPRLGSQHQHSQPSSSTHSKPIYYVYNPSDGTILRDQNGHPVTVGKLLATKPLKHEIMTRPGPGGRKLTYVSGESITRTLNDIFGFDGWDLSITKFQQEECLKDDKSGKFTVCYTAQVRLTHKASGSFREDCGAGDATDRSFGTAVSNALKASITDAMKRAARHFGDKCGNSLYQGDFSIKKAPRTLKEALDMYDVDRANTKFGFDGQNSPRHKTTTDSSNAASSSAGKSSSTDHLLPVQIAHKIQPQQCHLIRQQYGQSTTSHPPPDNETQLLPGGPGSSSKRVPMVPASSSDGRSSDSSSTASLTSHIKSGVEEKGRRVSPDSSDVESQQGQSTLAPQPSAVTMTESTDGGSTNLRRPHLYSVPAINPKIGFSASTFTPMLPSTTAMSEAISIKRTNPYSHQQHSYPNKYGGRESRHSY